MPCTLALLLNLLLSIARSPAAVTVQHLRCEYHENPLGTDALAPHLSGQLNATERGKGVVCATGGILAGAGGEKDRKPGVWSKFARWDLGVSE